MFGHAVAAHQTLPVGARERYTGTQLASNAL
jgi:hypothetical protein